MKYLKIRSMVFDVPDMPISTTENLPGASKAIVSMGLREDGKLFSMSSTLRADKLADWEYVKARQETTQYSWDLLKNDDSSYESLTLEQYDEEFNQQLKVNHAVEIPAYLQ